MAYLERRRWKNQVSLWSKVSKCSAISELTNVLLYTVTWIILFHRVAHSCSYPALLCVHCSSLHSVLRSLCCSWKERSTPGHTPDLANLTVIFRMRWAVPQKAPGCLAQLSSGAGYSCQLSPGGGESLSLSPKVSKAQEDKWKDEYCGYIFCSYLFFQLCSS